MDRFYIITNSDKDKKLEITEKNRRLSEKHITKTVKYSRQKGNMRVPFIIQILIRFRTIHSVLLFWEEMAHFSGSKGCGA